MILNLDLIDQKKAGTVREDTRKHKFEGDLHVCQGQWVDGAST